MPYLFTTFGGLASANDHAGIGSTDEPLDEAGSFQCTNIFRFPAFSDCLLGAVFADASIDIPSLPTQSASYPAGVTVGATLADFDPAPDYMQVTLRWSGLIFRGYHSGCYIDEDSNAHGCGPMHFNQPTVSFNGGDFALQPLSPGPVPSGAVVAPDGGGDVTFVDGANPSVTLAPPDADAVFGSVAGGFAALVADTPFYMGDPANTASNTLLPWGSVTSIDASFGSEMWNLILADGSGAGGDWLHIEVDLYWRSGGGGDDDASGLRQVVWVGWDG